MKAVEQNSNSLNEIAEAFVTTKSGARDAWRVIEICLTEDCELPEWVKAYLVKAAGKVQQAELENMAAALEIHPESEDFETKPTKAYFDSLTVFSVVAGWRREAENAGKKVSLESCFERYVTERLSDRDHEATVKTAYYRGEAIAKNEIALSDMIAKRS